MKKTTYILIVIGVTIILGIGILIGLNINNKLQSNSNSNQSNQLASKNVDETVENKEDIEKVNNQVDTEIVDTITNNEKIDENIKYEAVKTENITNNEDDIIVNEDQVVENNNVVNNIQETSSVKEKVKETNNVVTIPEVTKTSEIIYSTKDTAVINSLESTLSTINSSKVDNSFSDSAKATFINIVDFLFYDGTIKGYTFDELTDNGKAKVLELASKIDITIESKVPNYKDTISTTASKAYKNAAALIKKGSTNLNSFLQEKLSEADYNAIIDGKDDLIYYTKNAVSFLKDTGSKLLSTAQNKLSSWYNKYKNS